MKKPEKVKEKEKEKEKTIDPLFKDLVEAEEKKVEEKVDEKDKEILRLREKGKGYEEIAKELNVSEKRIAEVLKEHGLTGERKGKRKKVAPVPVFLFDDQTMLAFIKLPFDRLAKKYGDYWKLTPEEEQSLSQQINKVSSKWLPLWLEQYSDELALTLSLMMIIYPRYLETKERAAQAKESLPQKETDEE